MKEKLKMFTTFSGIGCQEKGFIDSNLFDIEVVATSDIDKDVIVSYAAIYCGLTQKMIEEYSDYPNKDDMVDELKQKNIGYDFIKNKEYDWDKLAKRKGKNIEKYWLSLKLANNLGDICKVKTIPECDILTFSFPCQSISIAGRQEGMIKGETRSGLVYEIVRLVQLAKQNNKLPKYLMLENVSALVSKKFKGDFDNLNSFFDNIGYNVYWSLINGKDCGVPQNRLRCFAIYIRKDIDTGKYTFPIPFDTGIRLKDVLEKVVEDKYYLSEEAVQKFKPFTPNKNLSGLKQAGQIYGTSTEPNPQTGRIYDSEYLSSTIDSCSGGNRMPKILQAERKNSSQDGVEISEEGVIQTHTSGHSNVAKIIQLGQVSNDASQAGKVYSPDGVSQTICACTHRYAIGNIWDYVRIRKLTPRETWRLMGLTFEDCNKAASLGVADTHLYKQAGNGIITNCCALLAEHLYKAQYNSTYICTDERYQEKFYTTTSRINSACGDTHKVYNPLKGKTPYGWHFEQEVYLPKGVARALKAGGGSGNIPKVILNQYYFTVEDGRENCIEKFDDYEDAYYFYHSNKNAREIFCFDLNDELIGCVNSKKI